MTNQTSLFLHEEVMLLALRDEKGTIASGTMYQYAIGSAILAELLLNKRISVEEVKKKKLVNLISPTPIGDSLIDECLEKISKAKKRASLQTWVSRFSGIKNLKHRAAQQLCDRGILRATEDTVLLIFSRKIYPEINPGPESKLIERLREAIFTDSRDIDARTVVLVSLANSTGLLNVVFDKKKLKGRKDRIKQIIDGEVTGKAATEAIQAMQTAIFVTCIMPTITTAAIH